MLMKKIFVVLVVVSLIFVTVGCGAEQSSEVQESEQTSLDETPSQQPIEEVVEPIVIKVSMQSVPDAPQCVGMRAASEYINEKSGGRIDMQVYDSASLSPQDTMIVDTQTGQVDITVPGPSFIAQTYPAMSILNAPFIFRDSEHLYNVIESGLVDDLFQGFEDQTDTVILDYWWLGTRTVSSNVLATTPEEFSGVKMRCPNAEMYIALVDTLGANPTPINFNEVYLALQTGTVDAQENPLNLILSAKFYEVQKYIIKTNHMVDGFTILINKEKWESIPMDLQQVVKDGLVVGKAKSDEVVIALDEEALEVFTNAGLEIVEVESGPFIENAKSVIEKFKDEWPEGLYDEIVNFQ